jgi:hypothetical protein
VTATDYGPDETWPQHQRPYWKVALRQARSAGWTLRYLGAPHWFGVVVCPTGEHQFSVDSTARGAETVAGEVPKLLRACPHGVAAPGGSKTGPRRAECDRLLTRAEDLIDQAGAEVAGPRPSRPRWRNWTGSRSFSGRRRHRWTRAWRRTRPWTVRPSSTMRPSPN